MHDPPSASCVINKYDKKFYEVTLSHRINIMERKQKHYIVVAVDDLLLLLLLLFCYSATHYINNHYNTSLFHYSCFGDLQTLL